MWVSQNDNLFSRHNKLLHNMCSINHKIEAQMKVQSSDKICQISNTILAESVQKLQSYEVLPII